LGIFFDFSASRIPLSAEAGTPAPTKLDAAGDNEIGGVSYFSFYSIFYFFKKMVSFSLFKIGKVK